MGRCSNRRTQERAAQERNIPSRARFSKGPPKKNGGRGGGSSINSGGGRDGGRGGCGGGDDGRGGRENEHSHGGQQGGRSYGGRGDSRDGRGGRNNNNAVIQKLQTRVQQQQQQRKDLGGISIIRSTSTTPDATIASITHKSNHALDGIDISKLDTITLSAESVLVVEGLLAAYNVWDGENVSDDGNACDMGVGGCIGEGEEPLKMVTSETNYVFTKSDDNGTYDDKHGDYEEEPDDAFRDNDINTNPDALGSDTEDDNRSVEERENDNYIDEDGEKLRNSLIFGHLTEHYSFLEQEAISALRASHKRLHLSRQKSAGEGAAKDVDDTSSKVNDGALLEMALDWLSLHLNESDLRRGFRVQKTRPRHSLPERAYSRKQSVTTRAVPHESISSLPKFTQEQCEKEAKASLDQMRRQNQITDLIRMGFHSTEVDRAFSHLRIEDTLSIISVEEEHGELQPLSIDWNVLKHLVLLVESEEDMQQTMGGHNELDSDMENASAVERMQESEALRAIYAEGFQLARNLQDGTDDLKYTVEVKSSTPLAHPACNEKSFLYVMTRRGYPLDSPPLLWFANSALPPTLLRRIGVKLKVRAKELIGQAAVFDLIEYLSEELSTWQKQFMDEEAFAEEAPADVGKRGSNNQCDIVDYDQTSLSVEERKNLPRRQRQKLRAAEKSYTRTDILLEKQRAKEQLDTKRRERIRIENKTLSTRLADKVVDTRWNEWVKEETEKAARKATNDAFLRGQGRDDARDAAENVKKEMLRFHGDLCEADNTEENASMYHPNRNDTHNNSMTTNFTHATNQTHEQEPASFNCNKRYQQIASKQTPLVLLAEEMRHLCKEKGEKIPDGPHLYAASKISIELSDLAPCQHLPTPMVTPSPCIEDVLKDITLTQRDQPWLIAPEARVPGCETSGEAAANADAGSKRDISKSLRIELERKKSAQYKQMIAQRSMLPAYKMRDQLLETICANQVTVVCGDTGCGKTTQVPQLVLDHLIMSNRGAEANIIVTQPRRISAIGVSERIAAERCERIGQSVGYSIRLESKRSNKTRLMLCTTGILLRRLQCDPDLASISHVFVDEVHERDLNTDFLLIILKDLLLRRSSLKLVLMSATMNAERFAAYFGGCPTVSIPGRAQPVKEFRLEDALQVTGHLVSQGSECAKKKSQSNGEEVPTKTYLKRLYPSYNQNVIDSLAVVDESITNYGLIADVLHHVCTTMEEGAVLIFLSGLKEITMAMDALMNVPYFQDSSHVIIYPLHSSLSSTEQTSIFQQPPSGKRKVVLSTNIAETSITIDDVVFVIDTGRVKENRYDDLNKMPTLTECWASKAATTQRRGRAGRVKPGYCWHLYSTHTNDNVLDDYQLPEMLRVGLEDLVLQILVLDLGEPAQFLTRAVDPPTDMSIKNALQLLESLGAAECDWDPTAAKDQSCLSVTTSLTALGYLLASIPVHPRVGKLLIYGNLFGVYDDCLTIAASMSSRSPFMSSLSNREAADKAKRGFASDDHIAVLLAFNSWMELRHRDGQKGDGQKAKIFLRNNFMSYHALSNIIQLRKQLAKYMSDVGFRSTLLGTKSSERDDIHLVRAVIAAGLYPNIIIAPETLSGKVAGEVVFRGREINDIYLHPSATSYTAKVLDSRYGCYHEIMKTSRIYVRDLTPVSKFALLLFGGDLKVFQTHSVVAVDGWLKFRVDAKPATLVKYLRSSLETLLLTKIMNPAIDVALSPKGKSVISAVAALLKMEGGK